MAVFHVIERSVWKRALLIAGLLAAATVLYALSGARQEAARVQGTSLFVRWLGQNQGNDTGSGPVEHDSDVADAGHSAEPVLLPQVTLEPITTGFFAEYRIERDRSRSFQLEQLSELMRQDSLGPRDEEARDELIRLLQRTEQELQIEGILRARGLNEALVVLADSGAIVVVGDTITQGEAGSIGNIVAAVTGLPLERITISDGVIAR